MRHIKLYEDYSEDELKDLMGDLDSVGQIKFVPVLGKDYGYTSDLLESPPKDREYGFYLTPQTVEFLIENKAAWYSGLSDKSRSVYFEDKSLAKQTWGSYGPGNYLMSLSLHKVLMGGIMGERKTLYQLRGFSGDIGFGFSGRQVGKKAKAYVQDQFVKNLKLKIEKLR
jgi:hypothetical protein